MELSVNDQVVHRMMTPAVDPSTITQAHEQRSTAAIRAVSCDRPGETAPDIINQFSSAANPKMGVTRLDDAFAHIVPVEAYKVTQQSVAPKGRRRHQARKPTAGQLHKADKRRMKINRKCYRQ
jgi:hypothetical protein